MDSDSKYLIPPSYDNRLVKDYLTKEVGLSRRNISQLKKHQGMYLNEKKTHANARLATNDLLEIFHQDTPSENIAPEAMHLPIHYEDKYILVVEKPSGIPVHQSRGHIYGTLSNGVAYHYQQQGLGIKVRPINRLDKDTSGLVLFAKSAHIQHLFANDHRFTIKKEYLAIVEKNFATKEGVATLPIGREEKDSTRRMVREDGDYAATLYKELLPLKNASLVRLELCTGRTHQIRVHMAYMGHRLLGDVLYEGNGELIQRQALHAFRVSFLHPVHRVKVTIKSKLPEDMRQVMIALQEGKEEE